MDIEKIDEARKMIDSIERLHSMRSSLDSPYLKISGVLVKPKATSDAETDKVQCYQISDANKERFEQLLDALTVLIREDVKERIYTAEQILRNLICY